MTFEKIPVYCPKCNRQVLTYDGRATVNLTAKCSKCQRLVTFKPSTRTTEIKEVPLREQNSGSRYY